MTGKTFFKIILLFILTIISYFYIYITDLNLLNILLHYEGILSLDEVLELLVLLLPITISLNLISLTKHQKKISIILFLFNLSFIIKIIYSILREFILFQEFNTEWLRYFYLITITLVFTNSILDRKKELTIYDNFIILLSMIGIFIFYRYYLDYHFLHNIFRSNYTTSGATTYLNYIHQYYLPFIIGYIILLMGNKIESLK